MSKQTASSTVGHFKTQKAASRSPLVLDGETVKLRIQAERSISGNTVHVDWVRFTMLLKNAPIPDEKVLFPYADSLDPTIYSLTELRETNARLIKELRSLENEEYQAAAQAHELAVQVAMALGPDFKVLPEKRKGMDFYKFRWSVMLNETEVCWVGFLASSESPRQNSQSKTIHANITGTACTFAQPGWNLRIAGLVDSCQAVLTRADLALDFFDGYDGGIDAVRSDYREGFCNVCGRKPKFNLVGDWENGHDRSVYIGSREAGKITNIYEKGDQLFGEKMNSEWLRFELRYGNKLRVLDSDMLRNPDSFFAGASDWHEAVLAKAHSLAAVRHVPVIPRLPVETIQAEVVRVLNWFKNTAGPAAALVFQYLDSASFEEVASIPKLPGRLQKFSLSQIASQFENARLRISTAGNMPDFLQAA